MKDTLTLIEDKWSFKDFVNEKTAHVKEGDLCVREFREHPTNCSQ